MTAAVQIEAGTHQLEAFGLDDNRPVDVTNTSADTAATITRNRYTQFYDDGSPADSIEIAAQETVRLIRYPRRVQVVRSGGGGGASGPSAHLLYNALLKIRKDMVLAPASATTIQAAGSVVSYDGSSVSEAAYTPSTCDSMVADGTITTAGAAAFPKDRYDNAGTDTALAGNDAAVHWVYLRESDGEFVVLLGQESFGSQTQALNDFPLQSRARVIPAALATGHLLLGWVVAAGNGDLDAGVNTAAFVQSSKLFE